MVPLMQLLRVFLFPLVETVHEPIMMMFFQLQRNILSQGTDSYSISHACDRGFLSSLHMIACLKVFFDMACVR